MKRSIIALLMVALPVLILAQPKEMMTPAAERMDKPMKFCQKLNLTDAQKEQLHQLQLDHQKKVIPLQADLKLARLDLDELINTDADAKKIDAAIKKVNEVKGQLFELRIKHQVAFRNILTDEQRNILKKCESENHPRFGFRKHKAGPRPRMLHGGDRRGAFRDPEND
jgi:Spy/CpxP family protein refolding chaperone